MNCPLPGLDYSASHTDCQRLMRLIDDILDIGNMDADRVTFIFGCVEVRALVEEVIAANRGYAKVIACEFGLPTSLPSGR